MRRFLLNFIALATLSIFITGYAHADSVVLTQERIDRFVESVPEIREYIEENHTSDDVSSVDISEENTENIDLKAERMLNRINSLADNPDLSFQLSYLAQKHGFSSLDDWAQTGNRIGHAWLSVADIIDSKKAKKTLSSSRKTIESDHTTPSLIQNHMLDLISSAEKEVNQIDSVTAKEKELVRSNLKLIKLLFQ